MEIKLANSYQYSFEEVMLAKDSGAKFVTYQWFVPLPLFRPSRRLSKVYYIPSNKSASSYAWKFNVISLIIGWWGLPWGPIFVFRSIRLNNSGGVDVTKDIYLNINKSSYKNGRLLIKSTTAEYLHPSRTDIKEYTKVFKNLLEEGVILDAPIIGMNLNTEDNEEPFLLIGFDEPIEEIEHIITAAIYKRFFKHTRFELINLNGNFKSKETFISQGLKIELT